jgi:NAD-dependent SIR2 family protein deacetylase
MIDLGSIAGLHAHGHQLAAYCARCDRWSLLDLSGMIREGRGELRLPVRTTCRDCGAAGNLQVRPPVPTRGRGGWMEPPSSR